MSGKRRILKYRKEGPRKRDTNVRDCQLVQMLQIYSQREKSLWEKQYRPVYGKTFRNRHSEGHLRRSELDLTQKAPEMLCHVFYLKCLQHIHIPQHF